MTFTDYSFAFLGLLVLAIAFCTLMDWRYQREWRKRRLTIFHVRTFNAPKKYHANSICHVRR